ncbi:MAG: hypothetical protein HS108_09890 [Planctomycetes bacterium]|jgi:hypothetical protein|nr:hypothetical protein [Planctomycetota bacterium]MCL4728853.1 hypothetical protein [Planctomycetota bacterium]
MAGDELAPWEAGSGRQVPEAKRHTSGISKPYVMPKPDQLPEIYRPDDAGFVAHGGATVPRPAPDPRPLDPRGKIVLFALFGAMDVGIIGVVLTYVILAPEAGVIRHVYAALAGVIGAIGIVALLAEFGRINAFRSGNFIPGVLVYGTKDQFLKVAGPAGTGTIQSMTAHGSGRGLLSLVFDRSAHSASPPEIVALHCDRGAGPEFVGIAWDAVRECRRGDIVWFSMLAPNRFLMYHKLIPWAPRVVTDPATREEVYRALKVGQSMFREAAASKIVGKPKVHTTDASGNIVTKRIEAPKGEGPAIPLAALGQSFASDDQPEQGAPGDYEPPARPGRRPGLDTKGNVRLSEPGKPLGGADQDNSGDHRGGYVGDA